MIKPKKNSQNDELYFDIISPSSFVEETLEEEVPTKKTFQIPIRKEKFSNSQKTKNNVPIVEEFVDEDTSDGEYEEVVEEVIVEEPEEKPIIKEKSKKGKRKFL